MMFPPVRYIAISWLVSLLVLPNGMQEMTRLECTESQDSESAAADGLSSCAAVTDTRRRFHAWRKTKRGWSARSLPSKTLQRCRPPTSDGRFVDSSHKLSNGLNAPLLI